MKNHPDGGSAGKLKAPVEAELLTPKEAAQSLKLSESFLAKARMSGSGPRYLKLARTVRYLRSDLSDWLKACAKGLHCRIVS